MLVLHFLFSVFVFLFANGGVALGGGRFFCCKFVRKMFQFVSIDLNVFNLHVFFVFAFIDARMLLNSRAKCCT